MGFSFPDTIKASKNDKNFLQPTLANRNWKGKKNGKRSNAVTSLPRFHPSLPFALQTGPLKTPFETARSEAPFRNHVSGSRNRLKRRRILARKTFYSPRAPLAPRNTTTFIMRAKKLGGIAPPVTPTPTTPAIIPTPVLSPGLRDKGSTEEMNKELGVDGYGSMNGLIRLRSYENRARDMCESESDVDQGDAVSEDQSVRSVERLEQRINQGLSRFEMIYPSRASEVAVPKNLENCVNIQERLIAHLEEENLTLKERLFLVEQEVNELRQRLRELEGSRHPGEPPEEHCEESCGDVSMHSN